MKEKDPLHCTFEEIVNIKEKLGYIALNYEDEIKKINN